MKYVPKVGDLLVRVDGDGVEHFRVGQVMPTRGDFGEPDCWLIADDGEAADIPWPDDDWTLVARGAVPLAERPPVPERDERSEVERLRKEVAELRGAERAADAEIDRLRDELMSHAAVRGDENDPATLRAWREGCESGVGEERARVLAVLRRRLIVALKERMQWAQGGNERVETIWAGVEREIRECAATLGYAPDELTAEREVAP